MNNTEQTNYVHVHQKCDRCDGCKLECAHKVKTSMTVSDAAHLQAAVQKKEEDLIENLDDIANKPWQAIRYLAEKFELLPGEYNAECAAEYRKLEAFYSNGGTAKINKLLADPSFNVNHPGYLQQLKKEAAK